MELVSKLHDMRKDVADLNEEEAKEAYDMINDIRLPCSAIYAAALGTSNRLYQKWCTLRGIDVTTPIVEEKKVPEKVTPKVVTATKQPATVDLTAIAKALLNAKLSNDDLLKIEKG